MMAEARPTVAGDSGRVSADNLRGLGDRGLHWLGAKRRCQQAVPVRVPDTLLTSECVEVSRRGSRGRGHGLAANGIRSRREAIGFRYGLDQHRDRKAP